MVKTGLFLDFDKRENIFYSNLYIDGYKLVVKTPIQEVVRQQKNNLEVKIEEFDLTRYTYLVAHD